MNQTVVREIAQKRIDVGDLLGAYAVLSVQLRFEKREQACAYLRQVSQFLLNFHSLLARMDKLSYWKEWQLLSDTGDFRNLELATKKKIEQQDRKINDYLRRALQTSAGRIVFCGVQADYWIRYLDGFRVALWLYRACGFLKDSRKGHGELGKLCPSKELTEMRDELKNMILPSLNIAPYNVRKDAGENTMLYSIFERIMECISSATNMEVETEKSNLFPSFSV